MDTQEGQLIDQSHADAFPSSLIPLLKDAPLPAPSETRQIIEQFQRRCGYTFRAEDLQEPNEERDDAGSGRSFSVPATPDRTILFGGQGYTELPPIQEPSAGLSSITRIINIMKALGTPEGVMTTIGPVNLANFEARSGQPKEVIAQTLVGMLATVTNRTMIQMTEFKERTAPAISEDQWATLGGILTSLTPDRSQAKIVFPGLSNILSAMDSLEASALAAQTGPATKPAETQQRIKDLFDAIQKQQSFVGHLGVKFSYQGNIIGGSEMSVLKQNVPANYLSVVTAGIHDTVKARLGALIPAAWR